jgi:outer membrane protein assembly factor BamB
MHVRLVAPVLAAAVSAIVLASALVSANTAGEKFWGQWRGPFATGVSKQADPPLEWSATTNVRWQVEIPGRGSGSPVVWGDRVYLLTGVPLDPSSPVAQRGPHRFTALAIDRRTGKTVWERVAKEEAPHEAHHAENGTWASSSAVVDGEHVLAYFESRGLFAFDLQGKLIWQKDFGDKRMRNQFGEGSTPVVHGNRVVVVWDHQGESFIAALDKRTGAELWRVKRDEIDTWATPLVVVHEGRAQVVVNGMNRLRSYDLETGAIVWETEGLTMNAIPSPVAGDGMVFVTSGFRGSRLRAVRIAEARGDITGSSAVVWTLDRDTPYVPSPLLYDGVLYILKSNNGILSVFDAKTGKPHYQLQRLDGVAEVFASPVGAAGRVYIAGRDGTTLVLRHGPTYEVLATNTLDDGFDASPALVDREIYLRGKRRLYCIAAN